jgi:predicted DNA-binding protein (UPF0251 family)/predicted Fe-Mo cluster-binding NifX family protein
LSELAEVTLTVEEFEALRLVEIEDLDQEEAARQMNVSRQTFSRILSAARRAVAQAVVQGQALCIEGGNYAVKKPEKTSLEKVKEHLMNAIVAIPSALPGGLNAELGAHFGHCELYTVVTLEQSEVKDVKILPNVPHQQEGCMAPVQHLASNGVQVLITGGMGIRPLMGFNQMGIEVFYGAGVQTVGQAVAALVEGKLSRFTQEFTCGGGGGCQPHPE